MTDHSLPQPEPGLLAASAHFDGVADADERALVEGSEELQGLVASFATMKAALNDLPVVPEAELEHTLAAALAEFDTLAAGPAAAPFAAPAAPARADHPRWTRVLAVAAAAVILGVVGVAIAKNGNDSSRQSTSAGEKAFDVATTAAASAGGALAPGTAGGAASSTIGAITGSADALPNYDQPADLRTLPGTEADATATADSGAPVVPAANSGTPGSNGQPLTGPLVFPFTCPLTAQQVFIAEISWKGAPAAAVRDTVTRVTQAIDPQCNVLVSVEP
jgi:hypothetical protein